MSQVNNSNNQPLVSQNTLYAVIVIVILVFIIESVIAYYGLKKNEYLQSNTQSYNPRIFQVVWIVLFAIIAFAWYDSLNNATTTEQVNILNRMFAINLALNFLWVLIFFGFNNSTISLFVLIILVIQTAFLIYYTSKSSIVGAGLLVLYFLWLIAATYLNYRYNKEIKY